MIDSYLLKNREPVPGATVFVYCHNEDDTTWVIATYDGTSFYRLELDETLNCLRKMPVNYVERWAWPAPAFADKPEHYPFE